MTLSEGIISITSSTLNDLCDLGMLNEDVWFGIRWVDGEIANDIILVEIDPYCELVDVSYDGKEYIVDFDNEILSDVVANYEGLPIDNRPSMEVVLRYHIEFDGAISRDCLHVGGRWTWGNRGYRSEKRSPDEFLECWRGQ